jgi:hypothetical protein
MDEFSLYSTEIDSEVINQDIDDIDLYAERIEENEYASNDYDNIILE